MRKKHHSVNPIMQAIIKIEMISAAMAIDVERLTSERGGSFEVWPWVDAVTKALVMEVTVVVVENVIGEKALAAGTFGVGSVPLLAALVRDLW